MFSVTTENDGKRETELVCTVVSKGNDYRYSFNGKILSSLGEKWNYSKN